MKELIIALGLFFFIEGILYALFPSKMKSILLKAKDAKESQLRTGGFITKDAKESQLRTGGFIFAIIGFIIIWYMKKNGI